MSEIIQLVIALVLFFLLDRFLKSYLLRKWLGGCCWWWVARSAALRQAKPAC